MKKLTRWIGATMKGEAGRGSPLRMSYSHPDHIDYAATMRQWAQRASLLRRVSARLGLQGKLVISFMLLLAVALGVSCWIFVWHSSERLSDTMGEQARQTSYALSLAARPSLASGNYEELHRISHDLIKSRNVLFVAFLDSDGEPVALASREADFDWAGLLDPDQAMLALMQVRAGQSPVVGEYLAVSAPVLSLPTPLAVESPQQAGVGTRLIGYVTVGISPAREQAQLRQINLLVLLVGGAIGLLGMPLAWGVVHRVFQPIRQLVDATQRLAAGDLEAQVAIHRPDMIGTLARSFNEMVQRVKEHREALAAANRGLEEKVQQRTVQLETANDRLSAEIAEKEDFLRAVSHDLNAPLRNIGGMTAMLLLKHRERLEEEAVHKLERIQKNVEIESDLISELLELSRIKTRRQKMELVDIDAMVRELGEMFESDLKGRGIELTIEQRLPVLRCEKARLRQVFQNLIDNAIKYMGAGQKSQIRVGCVLRSGEAEFYVSDTGMGIYPEELEKVFYVFRRGKQGNVQQVAGKGVGLASVKSIVETYQGRVWVESGVGEGSTFRFTINGQYVPAAHGSAVGFAKAKSEI